MGSGLVMILKIAGEDVAPVALVEDDDVVETFASNCADGAPDIGILLG